MRLRQLKKLERGGKRLVLALARLLVRRASPLAPPDWGERPHRVLYLRHDRIGDMILATSLIRAVARSHPTISLDVLASPANAPVLRHEPAVRNVLLFDRRRPWRIPAVLRALRRERYDAVLDCMVLSPSTTTLLLMLASGARHRIGIGGRSNAFALTLPVPPRPDAIHHVEHSAALAAAFGVDLHATDWRPVIVLTERERDAAEYRWREGEDARPTTVERSQGGTPRLLVNISAGLPIRRWPDERFVAVLRRMRERAPGAEIVIMGGPGDAARALAIAASGGGRVVPTASIRDALALVATADFVFTPDTSIAHAASAFERPAVVMYLRGLDTLYAPYHTVGRGVVSPGRTLHSLAAEPVLDALDTVLDSVLGHTRLVPGLSTSQLLRGPGMRS